VRSPEDIDQGHEEKRAVLRFLGVSMVIIGGLMIAGGLVSFFSAFGNNNFGPPRHFWLAFVGMPILGIGMAICKYAFLGTVVRYVAGEVAPAATDTLNYVAEEGAEGIEAVAKAVSHGLAEGVGTGARIRCPACNHENEPDARFCSNCAAAMSGETACPSCGRSNDADAKFCDGCGARLRAD